MLYRNISKTICRSETFLKGSSALNPMFGNFRSATLLSTTRWVSSDEKVKVTLNIFDGRKLVAEGKVGNTLLDVVVNNNLGIEGFGACEGNTICSTCHVVLKQEDYDRLPSEYYDELETLNVAYRVTPTSRLGCSVSLTPELDGLEVHVPEIKDARS